MKLQINKDDLEELQSLKNVFPLMGILYIILLLWFKPETNIFIAILFPIVMYIINYGPIIGYILLKSLKNEKN